MPVNCRAPDPGGGAIPPVVPYDPGTAVPMREALSRNRRASDSHRGAALHAMLGVGASDDDDASDSGVDVRSNKRRRLAHVAPQPPRAPPAGDTEAIRAYAAQAPAANANGEEVSEIRGPIASMEWRADDPYIHPIGRDASFFQPGDNASEYITERTDDFCFACTLSGDFAAVHVSTLSEMWKSAIVSYTALRAAAIVSEFYNENMRNDTDHRKPWTVRSVFEHYTIHEINPHTTVVQAIRDHIAVANHQLLLLNSRGPNGAIVAPDPSLVAAWMKTSDRIIRLQRDLNTL